MNILYEDELKPSTLINSFICMHIRATDSFRCPILYDDIIKQKIKGARRSLILKKKKSNKNKMLKHLFIESIKETISEEIAEGSLEIKELEYLNDTFFQRSAKKFTGNLVGKFTIEELKEFIENELAD